MVTITEPRRATMDAYLQALATRGSIDDYLTDDAELELVGGAMTARGRSEVVAAIRISHQEAFDGRFELQSLVMDADGSRAAIEATFTGRHTGEFAGIAATGREITVPYSVHYLLTDGGISRIRVYGLATELVAAIS